MFGRQRRPKSLSFALPILLPHQLHHPSAKSRRHGSRALSSRIAMLQPFGPFLPISLPQPLRLPVTHPHQARRIHHLQLFALHSRQHFYPSQFPLAHPDSPHPASFRGRSLGDISNEEKRGHYHRGSVGLYVVGHFPAKDQDLTRRAQRALRRKNQFSGFLCALCALNSVPSVLNSWGVSLEEARHRSRE